MENREINFDEYKEIKSKNIAIYLLASEIEYVSL
jgi:hypothetical protein